MKIIFLDFDGVITTEESHWNLDLGKMNLVKKIIDNTGAKIVISSSWRRGNLEDTINSITDTNNHFVPIPFLMPEDVIGVTSRMYAFKYGEERKHYKIHRGEEIQRWLEEHPGYEKYVILDDDTDMLLCQAKYFIQTHPCDGISEEDVLKAIEILNK